MGIMNFTFYLFYWIMNSTITTNCDKLLGEWKYSVYDGMENDVSERHSYAEKSASRSQEKWAKEKNHIS